MRTYIALLGLGIAAASAPAVLINFDDRPGMPPPYGIAQPVLPQYLINTQYEGLGVRFGSGGGGIVVTAPSNPVSPPNSASPTAPGPVMDFTQPVTAEFFLQGSPAIVDSVALTLSNTSGGQGPIVLTAYDSNGAVLGSTSTVSPSVTLSLSFAGQINRAVLSGRSFAFDNFEFNGLAPAPGGCAVLMALGVWACGRRGRGAT